MAHSVESSVVELRSEHTRRALLAGAGLAAGGAVGLAALSQPRLATASPADAGLQSITVSDVTHSPWSADPTGATDSRQKIQDCINDSQGIAAVYFPPGTYTLVGTGQGNGQPLLTLPAKTKLIGHGALSVLKAVGPGGSLPNPAVILYIQGDDVYVENLKLDGNNSIRFYGIQAPGGVFERLLLRSVEVLNLNTLSAIGIRVSVRNSVVEDCHVHHTQRDGMQIFGENVVVRGNLVEDCGDDHLVVTGTGGPGVSVVGNVVKANTTRYGCGIVALNRVSVVGNAVFGGVHSGIEVKGGSTDVLISGNTVSEAGNSDGSSWPGITALSYGSPKGAGISVFSSSGGYGAPASRVVISDNVIVSPRSCGVFLISQSSSSVSDIRIEGNSIWMEPLANPANPALYNSDANGVTVRRNGVGVVSDTVDSPPVGPIADIRITDNDIRLATGAGIHARSGQCMRWDIRDNSVLDSGPSGSNQAPGILLDGVNSAMVIGNRAQETRSSAQDYGIKILNESGKYLVTDNDVSSSQGISPHGPVQGPTLWIKDNLGDDLV